MTAVNLPPINGHIITRQTTNVVTSHIFKQSNKIFPQLYFKGKK